MSNPQSNKKKGGQGGGGSGSGNQDSINQDKLVAIVLLDSYSTKFEPFSSTVAECLLPIAGGKCLLDVNLEFLVKNQVEEIVLFCTRHSKQIKNYLEKSNWRQKAAGIEIHLLYNFKCRSLGDAMREIDAKGHVRSTFVLMNATGVVSNLSLAANLEHHRAMSKIDKNVVMTVLCTPKLSEFCPSSGANKSDSLIVHNANKRILYYHRHSSRHKPNYLVMPSTLLTHGYTSIKQAVQQRQLVESANARFNLGDQNNNSLTGYQGGSSQTIAHFDSVQLRADLVESQIYLCNSHVLHMFTDNFDHETMEQFVNGVLSDEEVSGYVIHMDVLRLGFGAHFSVINDLNSYYVENMRLLARADLDLDFELFRRQLDRLNVFTSKSFVDNCRLGRNVFIEAGCRIGENCQLENCFIASNCHLAANVKLTNSIVWSGARIGPNSVVNACLLGFGVHLGANVKICENCVFGNEVQIKDNTAITQRGVYVRKDTGEKKDHHVITPSSDNNPSTPEVFEVTEDNYTKLILSNQYSTTSEEDEEEEGQGEDEFGSDIDDEEAGRGGDDSDDDDDDDDSVASRGSAYDTSKNRHFLVWHAKSSGSGSSGVALRKSISHDSDSELSDESDDESDDEKMAAGGDHDPDDDDMVAGGERKFLTEVDELLREAIKKNMDPTNLILQISGSALANNVQIDDLNFFLAKAIFNLPIFGRDKSSLASFDYFGTFKTQIHHKTQIALLENYYKRTKKSQFEFLNSHLDFFLETTSKIGSNSLIDSSYVKTLHYLFNECEFLSDEAILEWYEKQSLNLNVAVESKKYAIGKLKPFIEWLKEDEEDDDDDDDEDDE